MQRFDNKVILITGASSGIGAATAKRLASEGAKIFGVGRNIDDLAITQQAIEQSDGVASMQPADISVAHNCRDVVAQCIEHYGRLDVLINCAGGHVFRALHEVTDELWLQDLAVNLGSAFYLSQAAIPQLLETGGNIVNIGSLASVQGQAYSATYCSAKHGIIGLTKALALEFINQNIRINAVCPGGTNTPQIAKVGMPENADFDLIMRTAGVRGMSEAEDIAAVIAFIASDDAKAIHGSVYMADQGKTIG
ncbi:SDR family NAD(P)-dependent oxidoreductase [Oceanicoccus sp. KOV_DT_Chl]|uniref:SDR family NAD(P)-dependent oxidoreductase n=1 Tax=Oceanicoccus sp. KOV_DT_Chl TaxID=1904639 RepID=UPI000C79DCC9|nr:SDR family oxidoreductase [Oceanicoccus sp. KOV_DT_Chl]